MRSALWSIAWFDFRRRVRSVSMWVYFALYALISALWTAAAAGAFSQVSINFGGDKVLVNGTYALALGTAVMGFLGVTMIGSIAGRAVQQDYEAGIQHFFFSAPIAKRDYFMGRLVGAWMTLLVIFAGVALGVIAGTHWPGVDATRVVAQPSLESFVRPYLFVLVPNFLWLGGCFFVLAALTRQMAPVYVAGVLVLVGYAFSLNLLSDMDNKTLSALIDPSGATAVDVLTRYWGVAQKNGDEIPLSGVLLWNRAIWCGLGALATVAGYVAFRMDAMAGTGRSRRRAGATATKPPTADATGDGDAISVAHEVALPRAVPDRRAGAYLRMLPGLAGLYLREIVKSPRFLTIVMGGVLLVVGNASTLGSISGTNTMPLTYKVLDVVAGLFSVFVLIVTIIYAGELVWRERDVRIDDIVDSMPSPTWLPFGAKLATLVVLQMLLLTVVLVCSIGVQLAKGFTTIELGHYLFELYVLQLAGTVLVAVLALVVHTLIDHKYLGHFVVGVIVLVIARLPDFGFENKLYLYGARPEVVYSDMNGYGHFLPAVFWFRLYWWAFATVLVVLAYATWVRGRERGWRARWRGLRVRLAPRFARIVLACATLVFVATGAWIHVNTHVTNPFVSKYEAQRRQAEYERRYKALASTPQPRISAVELAVDLMPERNAARVAGTYALVNRSGTPIQDLYVLYLERARVRSLAFDVPSRLVEEDPRLWWHHHRLDAPLAPGATTMFRFDLEYAARGFGNDGADRTVLGNGTFLNAGESALAFVTPSFGYAADGELESDRDRRRFDLAPRPRMPDLDDSREVMNNALSRDADFIDYRARVCTAADQLPVTSGYVERDWTERDASGVERRCIAYRMDTKMADLYSFVSARYAQRRDVWKGADGDVAIEIDYHRGHEYDLDRMMAGVKDSLDYFTTHFSPYQHRIVRIIEFPRQGRQGGFAESFPNTIPFNESIGFTAKVDDRDPTDIDYPYFVTAHEMAHQWWAHQEMPANVQGAEFVTESLAEYSALMVLKKKHGDAKMRRFLKYELDRYLMGRGTEQKEELPLVRADGAAYIHYQKGALVLYALQDAIGEAAVNDALARFMRRWRFEGPPYPRSVDLIAELRGATPAAMQPLIDDWFESITLYDVRALSAKATKRADGRYDLALEVSARQVRADGAGKETDVPFRAPVDLGGLDADGNAIGVVKRAVPTGTSTITIVVDRLPVRAGIDPLDKLIDRDQSDNVVAVGS